MSVVDGVIHGGGEVAEQPARFVAKLYRMIDFVKFRWVAWSTTIEVIEFIL